MGEYIVWSQIRDNFHNVLFLGYSSSFFQIYWAQEHLESTNDQLSAAPTANSIDHNVETFLKRTNEGIKKEIPPEVL